MQLYQHDFSEIRDLPLTRHGTFTYAYLDHYFTEPAREAYFIEAGGELGSAAEREGERTALLHSSTPTVGDQARDAKRCFARVAGDARSLWPKCEGAGLVRGKRQFTKSRARARAKQADVARDLVEASGERV